MALLSITNKLYASDSSNIHLLYKYAESLRKYNNYDLASYYYNKIVEKDKAGRIYKDAWFWFAADAEIQWRLPSFYEIMEKS